MADPMRALTLHPEWCPTFTTPLAKNIENRSWPPPKGLIGKRLAFHAGASVGGSPGASAFKRGAAWVTDTARAAGWEVWLGRPDRFRFRPRRESAAWDEVVIPRSVIVFTAVLLDAVQDAPSPWAMVGSWHWRLGSVVRLATPVPCKGAQGLWTVPDDVVAAVRAQGGGE